MTADGGGSKLFYWISVAWLILAPYPAIFLATVAIALEPLQYFLYIRDAARLLALATLIVLFLDFRTVLFKRIVIAGNVVVALPLLASLGFVVWATSS